MKTLKIKPDWCSTEAEFHALLARELDFPDHYGMNLDALFDCLTDIRRSTRIVLPRKWLGPSSPMRAFTSRLLAVLRDAAEANPHFCYRIE